MPLKTLRIRVHFPDWFTRLFPRSVWRIPSGNNTVYLTFDDGPVPEVTPAVLEILKKNQIQATFFCVGENVSKFPELYQQIIQEGHSTGNHTYNHIKGLNNSTKNYLKNVENAATLIQTNLFRPPYGMMKQSQFRNLRKKYRIILWDVISCDYDSSLSPEECISNVMDYVRDGSIITFHDSVKAKTNILKALPEVIEKLAARGYTFRKIEFPGKERIAQHTTEQIKRDHSFLNRRKNRA